MKIRELRVTYASTPLQVDGRQPLRCAATVVDLLRPLLAPEPTEVFLILLLNTKLRPLGIHTVSRGILDMSVVHPREVFRAAFLGNAATIITAHNHPSGDPTPSPDDLTLWRRLSEAGDLLGVQVLDHLVITEHGYHSAGEASR